MTPQAYPPWVVLHVPHDSTAVPAEARAAFVLDDAALQQELLRMTDHHTLALFAGAQASNIVRAPVSGPRHSKQPSGKSTNSSAPAR